MLRRIRLFALFPIVRFSCLWAVLVRNREMRWRCFTAIRGVYCRDSSCSDAFRLWTSIASSSVDKLTEYGRIRTFYPNQLIIEEGSPRQFLLLMLLGNASFTRHLSIDDNTTEVLTTDLLYFLLKYY